MEKIQIEWIRKCFIQEIYFEMGEKKNLNSSLDWLINKIILNLI